MQIDTRSKETMHPFYQSTAWRKLRLQAIERDNHECVWCKEQGKLTTTNLEVDHIKELEYYPELALDLDNLRTLCRDCHNKRHNRYQRTKKVWDDEQFEW